MELSATVKLAQQLVKIESITPNDNGCQNLIADILSKLGFKITFIKHQGVTNLLAMHGEGSPFLLFLGHTDVVPTGDENTWQYPPFSGEIVDYEGRAYLYGRGSSDMKGGDAAMVTAMCDFVKAHPNHPGTIGLLLTSNEEGDAVGGTPYVAEYLKEKNLIPDYCLIAECSCDETFGDSIKNGRRGDLNATIKIKGIQGHAAMEQHAKNADFEASRFIEKMLLNPIDHGTKYFPQTSFQVSNIHAGTGADNVIPGLCTLRCNFRWNDLQTPEKIEQHVRAIADSLKLDYEAEFRAEGAPFLTEEGKLIDVLSSAISEVTGKKPTLGTSGGTSDGRFIRPLGPQTVEFGPVANFIHKVDERVAVDELDRLHQIFVKTLEQLF